GKAWKRATPDTARTKKKNPGSLRAGIFLLTERSVPCQCLVRGFVRFQAFLFLTILEFRNSGTCIVGQNELATRRGTLLEQPRPVVRSSPRDLLDPRDGIRIRVC